MGLSTRFLFIFICIIFLPASIYAQDVCVKKSSCICEFSNGTGIDLTPINKSTFFTAQTFSSKMNGTQIELSTYYYHPCFDVTLMVNTTAPNTCNKPLAVSTCDSISLLFIYLFDLIHLLYFLMMSRVGLSSQYVNVMGLTTDFKACQTCFCNGHIIMNQLV